MRRVHYRPRTTVLAVAAEWSGGDRDLRSRPAVVANTDLIPWLRVLVAEIVTDDSGRRCGRGLVAKARPAVGALGAILTLLDAF